MSEQAFFFGNQDQLKLLLKESIREVLLEFNNMMPYPASQKKIDEKKLLTRKQAAEYLQVTPNTITRYVKQGKLLPAIINGKYRFFEKNLMNLLTAKEK